MDFKKYVNMYEFETELPGSGKAVKFKPITTGQIKRLLLYETSGDSDSVETSLDNIISECVVNEDFNIDDLYLQDRFYLLLDLRKATKGNTYSFQSKCGKCESQSAQSVNLSSLPVKKLVKEEDEKQKAAVKKIKATPMKKGGQFIEEPVEESKPLAISKKSGWNVIKIHDNLSIRVAYLTRALQKQARDYLQEMKKLTDDQKAIEETSLMYAITINSVITPEGETSDLSLDDKIYLIENLTPSSMDLISKWFENNDFGVDFSFEVVCAHCQNKEKKSIPLDNFFF